MKRVLSFVLCLFSISVLSSCGLMKKPVKSKYTAYSFDYFDTVSTIVGYADSEEEFQEIKEEIFNLLNEYHRLYTIYNRYEGINNLCAVNAVKNGAHEELEVDSKIIDLLVFSKEMYLITEGKTNIAMGSVLSIWHNYREEGIDDPVNAQLPPAEVLSEAAKHMDINDLIINEEKSTVYLADPLMKLDVGAIAKGYATERIAEELEKKGITGYTLNIGGNIRTIGEKGDGEKWLVGIENPDYEENGEPYFEVLGLSGESLVTSGSYQRYYIVDGKNYHHIIDSTALMPPEYYLLVSVICKDSGMADALSTALFCMAPKEGLEKVENMEDVEALWVYTSGEVVKSSGFDRYLSNAE